MNVLTNRALSYLDETGNTKELTLTIFMPFEAEEYPWKCGFVTDPPIRPKIIYGVGIDFLWAFVECLRLARMYFETFEQSRRVRWRGMPDCGLPEFAEEQASPAPMDIPPPFKIEGSMDVLATRPVGFSDESGVKREGNLTIFVPSKAEDDTWKCGFTFDPPPFASIRYGVGADFIEALLDGLAKARATYEGMTPKGSEPLEESLNCEYLPYKVGRSFWLDSSDESLPDTPDGS